MEEKGIILCVDDEEAVVNTLKEQLGTHFQATHDVVTAQSGDEALEFIESLDEAEDILEMVIADQRMQGMQGDELLAKVHARCPGTIKVLLTGQASYDDTVRAINYGGLHLYVEKPWDSETLKRDVEKLIYRFRENLYNRHIINRLERRIQQHEGSD